MAELATLARPYANAVFGLARREKRLDQWSRMLEYLATAASAEPMARLLASPAVSADAKAYRLADVCGDVMTDAGRSFVNVLAANRRLDLIGEIRTRFEELRAEEEKVLDVEVISAYDLTDMEAQRVIDSLKKRFDKEIQLSSRVDESLIGGAIVRAGDMVVDGSVRGKLEKLSEALTRV